MSAAPAKVTQGFTELRELSRPLPHLLLKLCSGDEQTEAKQFSRQPQLMSCGERIVPRPPNVYLN
jgi:hypothetical protein